MMNVRAFAAFGNGVGFKCRPIDVPEWAWSIRYVLAQPSSPVVVAVVILPGPDE